jgi:hypothetical protein
MEKIAPGKLHRTLPIKSLPKKIKNQNHRPKFDDLVKSREAVTPAKAGVQN